MERKHHYIKILPEYFKAIESGEKTFEVRFNDRNYQVHDILHLRHVDQILAIKTKFCTYLSF